MAYTFDVYRGRIEPEKHFGIFATYIAFFPQLVAGPIERAANMLPQFRIKFGFDYERVVSGLRLILWGAFKKIVIADRLAIYVNEVYNDPTAYDGFILFIATIFFGYQIYCDFSGYSDIAIGTARVLGFDLMQNFNHPYLADSIRDFWRRWHISLSTWFRDYVYIPLGGNRVGKVRNLFNLFIVFLVSGLWHGAAWTFVIWGAIHGVLIVLETLFTSKKRQTKYQLPRLFRVFIIFGLVNIAWIFFRANSLPDAMYILQNIGLWHMEVDITAPFARINTAPDISFMFSIALIVGLQITEYLNEFVALRERVLPIGLVRWVSYYMATALIIMTLFELSIEQSFIYFQF